MRQKVALAGALVHDPRLIILDEPLTGLDAVSARHVKGLLGDRVRAGCTVIMTTHILEVAERMADRIGVIASGRLVAEGTLAELRQQNGQQRHQPRGHVHRAGRCRGRRRMSSAAALTWFARHEIRLAWREWLAMMTGGRRRRKRAAVIGLIVFAAIMHLPAYAVIGRFADLQAPLDKSTLIVITATILLAWALMLSQAIESVTRVFYARADLDLIMSSPVAAGQRVFGAHRRDRAVGHRDGAVAVDAVRRRAGDRRRRRAGLPAFGVVVAIGLSAAAVAIAVTVVLFRLIGPSRTRLVAQILAAVIGAGFVIALQVAAILSYGTLSRFAVLTSDAAAAFAPDADSLVWWPARAALGDGEALLLLLAGGLVLLGAVMAIFSPRVCRHRRQRFGAMPRRPIAGSRARAFRAGSRQQALRWKEFVLLRRDPWLVSQTPDAAALSGAAGADAVAKLCRQFRPPSC